MLTRALPLLLFLGCTSPPPRAALGGEHVVENGSPADAALFSFTEASSPVEPAPASVAASSETQASAASDATFDAQPPASTAASIEFETPYKLWHRPRVAGDVQAAGNDEELARWNLGGNGDPGFKSSQPGYHPATRVRVDARALPRLPKQAPLDRRTGQRARVLSEQSLLAQARKQGYWPFRLCFEEGARADRKLKGETVVRASIGATGRVSSARLRKTALSNKKTAECLVERVHKLEFFPPPRRVDVELSIQIWPGDAPLPSVEPPAGEIEAPGVLDVARLETALEPLRSAAKTCYSSAFDKDPKLWGRVELRFDLDPKGRLTRAAENESRFPERGVVRCLVDAARALELAAAKGGALSFIWAVRFGQAPSPTPPALPPEE